MRAVRAGDGNVHANFDNLDSNIFVATMTSLLPGLELDTIVADFLGPDAPLVAYSSKIELAWPVYEKIYKQLDPTALVRGREVWVKNDHYGPTQIFSGEAAAHSIALAAEWFLEQRKRKRRGESSA